MARCLPHLMKNVIYRSKDCIKLQVRKYIKTIIPRHMAVKLLKRKRENLEVSWRRKTHAQDHKLTPREMQWRPENKGRISLKMVKENSQQQCQSRDGLQEGKISF